MTRSCALNLAVLVAFVAAHVESLDHRTRHAAEEAAEAAEAEASLCPYAEESVHLCADRADAAHAPDCALCMAGTILVDASTAGPGHAAPPVQGCAGSLDPGTPSVAPDAGLSDPRGPPSL